MFSTYSKNDDRAVDEEEDQTGEKNAASEGQSVKREVGLLGRVVPEARDADGNVREEEANKRHVKDVPGVGKVDCWVSAATRYLQPTEPAALLGGRKLIEDDTQRVGDEEALDKCKRLELAV